MDFSLVTIILSSCTLHVLSVHEELRFEESKHPLKQRNRFRNPNPSIHFDKAIKPKILQVRMSNTKSKLKKDLRRLGTVYVDTTWAFSVFNF